GPCVVRVEDVAHGLGLVAVVLQTPMLQLDTRAPRRLGDKAHLHFGVELRIVAPVGGHAPSQYDAVRGVPYQHAAPVALAAVVAALEPAPAHPRLHDRGEALAAP